MKLVIDATDMADQLSECKVGDTEKITIEITAKTKGQIEGTATEVEHEQGEDYSDEMPMEKGKKGMPRAILMISK